jgi:prophage antirepressor-like protein
MEAIVQAVHTFDDRRVTTVQYQGKNAWIGREVGVALGYAQGGKRFASRITGEWSSEFIDGKDYAVLTGREAAMLQQAAGVEGTDAVPLRSNRGVLVLFESGLYLALAKTEKEAGVRFRRFLVDEVMPQLSRTGRYTPPSPAPAPQPEPRELLLFAFPVPVPANRPMGGGDRERRLAAQHALRVRKFESESLRETVRVLHHLDHIDPTTRAAYEVAAIGIALGQELPDLRPVVEERWHTPTQIAKLAGVTVQAVGLLVTQIGLRGADGLSRQVMTRARHVEKVVFSWVYNDTAVSRILAAVHRDEPPRSA